MEDYDDDEEMPEDFDEDDEEDMEGDNDDMADLADFEEGEDEAHTEEL